MPLNSVFINFIPCKPMTFSINLNENKLFVMVIVVNIVSDIVIIVMIDIEEKQKLTTRIK